MPRGAGAMGGSGDGRPVQSLVGGWHHVGSSINENAKKGRAIKCGGLQCALQQGKVHQKKINGGFICGCSIMLVISVPAVHLVRVPFLMKAEQE